MISESDTYKQIKEFTDLIVWQKGHKLVLTVYLVTKKFPREELFGLSSQMRRAGVSITSNIAEGFGRKGFKEKIQFYYLAQGSLTELRNQLILSRDVGYFDKRTISDIEASLIEVHRLLQGLITKSKTFL